ncbi:MAG: ABC transporter permease [Alphaproteobacteria bacterium]|nr:ABC transporter permease [Alphaproteobacteria bacterium]
MKGRRSPVFAKISSLVLYVFLPFALLALWQGLFALGVVRPLLLPPPTRIAAAFAELLGNGDLLRHLGISMLRVCEGFLAAAALGIGLGIALGLSRTLEKSLDLVIQLMKPIPPIAWVPLTILWFGIGEESKVFIIFLGAFFPILMNTIDGIRQTDVRFVEVARVFETSRWRFVSRVVLPGALPSIMTGLRFGMMVAWMCVVAAELVAASSGIGFLIMDARQMMQTDQVFVGMITIGATGKLLDVVLRKIERRLIAWKVEF